jgi:protein-S-isoprenylcysteine O-methyltransferase Ste14
MEILFRCLVGSFVTLYLTGFIIKNITTAKRTKQAVKGNSIIVTLVTITTTLLYLMTYLCVSYKPDHLLIIKLISKSEIKIIGLALIITAFVIGIISMIAMRDSWRVGVRPEQQTELITNGIFRFSRNPYFLSYYLMFLGVFLIYPTYLFLAIYLIWLVFTYSMILEEEKHLMKQHGEIYVNYKNKVNRYITLTKNSLRNS